MLQQKVAEGGPIAVFNPAGREADMTAKVSPSSRLYNNHPQLNMWPCLAVRAHCALVTAWAAKRFCIMGCCVATPSPGNRCFDGQLDPYLKFTVAPWHMHMQVQAAQEAAETAETALLHARTAVATTLNLVSYHIAFLPS